MASLAEVNNMYENDKFATESRLEKGPHTTRSELNFKHCLIKSEDILHNTLQFQF